MKNRPLMVATGVAVALLVGCGSSSPEDVAVTFATSLSHAKMDEVKSTSSETLNETLTQLKVLCDKYDAKLLFKEATIVLAKIKESSDDKVKKGQIDEVYALMKKDLDSFQKNFLDQVTAQYGSPRNIPKEDREKLLADLSTRLISTLKPHITKIFDISNVKTDHPDEIKSVIAEFFVSDRLKLNNTNTYTLQELTEKTLLKREDGITPQCVAEYTDYGNIDTINVLEAKHKSPDQVEVRMEIIREDGKSQKVTMETEMIKNEWKVSELELKSIYW